LDGGFQRRGPRPGVAFALALLILCREAAPGAVGQGRPAGEYQVKAVFLYHFAQFVQWPPESFPDKDSPLVLGILGRDPFDSHLEEVVRGETIGSRPLQVARFDRVEQVGNCHLLFISASETPRLEAILAALRNRRILTVGESEGFCRMGGMVAFLTRGGKIRLRINLEALQAAGLAMSSKLLRLAEIEPPGKG
jgi:hypothetical protein